MNAKAGVLLIVVVFLGFWMFTDPGGLAVTAREGGAAAWDVTQTTFRAIITFIGEL